MKMTTTMKTIKTNQGEEMHRSLVLVRKVSEQAKWSTRSSETNASMDGLYNNRHSSLKLRRHLRHHSLTASVVHMPHLRRPHRRHHQCHPLLPLQHIYHRPNVRRLVRSLRMFKYLVLISSVPTSNPPPLRSLSSSHHPLRPRPSQFNLTARSDATLR